MGLVLPQERRRVLGASACPVRSACSTQARVRRGLTAFDGIQVRISGSLVATFMLTEQCLPDCGDADFDIVYSHISNACGFRPREPNSKQLVYSIAQSEEDERSNKLRLSLAATAEIPFAAMKAETSFNEHDLPLRIVGSSRCFRPEAGARGRESRGLFRVHEFTKVEMFAWGMKGKSGQLFDQMLEIQLEILRSLGLSLRVLEMPARDLGHSAYRKRDIEAFFPSRLDRNEGWGEVTSLSMCTDYQTRRLETKVQLLNGSVEYPETVNGTAMAVPRVLAALLEYGWDESERAIKIPECLWPWTDGKKQIEKKL